MKTQNSLIILTNDGGLQQKAFLSKILCITFRNTIQRTKILSYNANQLVMDTKNILNKNKLNKVLSKKANF